MGCFMGKDASTPRTISGGYSNEMRNGLKRWVPRKPKNIFLVGAGLLALAWVSGTFTPRHVSASSNGPSFVEFESGHVRPLALSADGNTLFAVNTPNGTLEIFDLSTGTPKFAARVPVGLEPVAVAARSSSEVWVVNHLSDSVSVVTLGVNPHVTRTLLVGDEPRDIVFAGNPARAFITTAHRGQQRTDPSISTVPGAGDPQFTTPGVGRADVWIFDPAATDSSMGGTPLKIMSFFTDTPRALTVSPDGNTVYVAGFKTGNQTTTVLPERVCAGFQATPCKLPDGTISPGGNPGPATDAAKEPAPETGLIVKYNNSSGHWEDELHRNWDGSVRFTLPDTDVFSIDANALTQVASFAHVGTTLFNMATNPVTGHVYVTNSDAVNNVRFEGPGVYAGHTVQGHLAEMRITVIADSAVNPRQLNKHLDYTKLAGSPGFDPTAATHSLATPLGMAITGDGKTLYVAAFGSSKIGMFATASLEDNSFDPVAASANYIPVSGGGPSGLALDEARGQMYVMTRFDNAVKVVSLAGKKETAAFPLPNPEPASVVQGRPFLYDATQLSGNGEATCSSCHIFDDMDDLAWDLGNPDGAVTTSPIPINLDVLVPFLTLPFKVNGSGKTKDFHPMKGPFTTQTLRGIGESGAMHWRGDRSTGPAGTSATDPYISFNNFAPAFQSLIGSANQPTPAQMQAFANFQMQVMPPPNPVRNLDNSYTAAQQTGHDFYTGTRPSDGILLDPLLTQLIGGQTSFSCNGCHTLDASMGSFGTGGNQSFENLPQVVKIPQLRNLYAKIGMFGTPSVGFYGAADSGNMGAQIRGFGFTGDGGTDTVFRFLSATVFDPTSTVGFPQSNPDGMRRNVEQFILAFDTDLAPIVGQQSTLTAVNGPAIAARIDMMIERAGAPFTSKALGGTIMECDLVVRVVLNGKALSFLYDPASNEFISGDGTLRVSDTYLRDLANTPGQEVTYTAATPGSGQRLVTAQ
jgi:DNA-binding beta-propeller fold protein YncE